MDEQQHRSRKWFVQRGLWWLCSLVFHVLLLVSIGLVGMMGAKAVQEAVAEKPPSFDATNLEATDVPTDIARFELGQAPKEPSELNTESLTLQPPSQIAGEERGSETATTEPAGGGVPSTSKDAGGLGLGGFNIEGIGSGPSVSGRGGVGLGQGTGTQPGMGGDGFGFGGRGASSRKSLLGSGGGTKQSERAVAAALNWLARHQLSNGAWGLGSYKTRCKDATCTGIGRAGERPAAATALGLLPFLAAGQTNDSRGPYKKNIAAGIKFLVHQQGTDGNLAIGGDMYDHGLAAIALCECYGMTGAKNLRGPAQAAIDFIVAAQDPKGGGWRYRPQEPGDTSVTGWQVMALKSAQMAYLTVPQSTFDKAKVFLSTVTFGGPTSGRFSYMPGARLKDSEDYERATTAIGLLCGQYLGTPRTEPWMINGTGFLMQNLPDTGVRNFYYAYHATQVMHNQPSKDWDAWNRKMRHILIDTQCKSGCGTGSWDPDLPTKDAWGTHGGRLMMTSLGALTLEIYYRYLPLYKIDKTP